MDAPACFNSCKHPAKRKVTLGAAARAFVFGVDKVRAD
jgi:hypothetical protein